MILGLDHDKVECSPPEQFIFVHPPRTGGTSIETSFIPSSWEETQTKHLPASSYGDHVLNKSFVFATIRNPFDIIVSKYRTGWYSPFIKYDDPIDDVKLSFSLWLSHYVSGNCPTHNEYGSMLVDYLDRSVDFIIRYESRDNDINNMSRIFTKFMNIHVNIDTKIHESNTFDGKHYSEYYNDNSKRLAENFCKEDLETFNYDFCKG